MSKKKTIEEFKIEVNIIHNNNIMVLGDYINNKTKILVKYKDCGHEDMKMPIKLLAGQGCSKCKGKRISKSKLNDSEDIKNKLLKNKIILLGEYKGLNVKTMVRNIKCNHEYEVNIGNAINGSGCPVCHGFKDTDKFKEEVSEKYGNEYEVLGKYINNKTKIRVKHNKCGYIWDVVPKDLLKEKRCPHCIKSKGEAFISDLLKEMNIDYISQYRFKDCVNVLPLPFDFMVEINGEIKLIEFDGCQHFKQGNGWGNKENFNKTIVNDNIKNEFCLNNNIPLLRIPYWWIRNDKAEKELKKFLFDL